MTEKDPLLKYREQHKHRLNYMPWLYWSLKPKNKVWAEAWQKEYQAYLMQMETVEIGENCFISPLAHIFAEPGRKIIIGDNCFIAADCSLHGPIQIGNEVAINHHSILDGGRVGIKIHDQVRIAAYSHFYAFDHGMDLEQPIYQQAVTSKGIEIEQDVWIGAHVGVKDGVKIGKHAVVGMNSMVTKDVESCAIVAGNPAKLIKFRD
ncbi:DapH/DapD/GlmU-related protein [Acinetobacter gerneri]|uniref:DapH/DapD/GlmU-related protein n=1 Tax=Acinetobacter gerneri TaxID=202952 RepID=A0AAW8JN28_9GAMM|nr:DapH/DapD/GlmU-related protein [Acinetobacter gerneri]MDQ9011620.1 DapH/DapD/GlmU-related protein [Acinetobacter gerneri]MDQ9015754.1 DapH/DapD/GlmU-related protein [Acinetobacter gerneri]MDQ9026925.1 DapH/DapD/GlmU-related protein [Acinetobacter gerneri]MDQ9054208.1 DapH/DapD/GlmU-related protein [Acinetobacter gerneri]MDQ9061855.1 DapH/DapD/GlmU-related protein [Acinetobacter gerneri]